MIAYKGRTGFWRDCDRHYDGIATSASVFKIKYIFLDISIQYSFSKLMTIDNFRGDLTDLAAIKNH